jgi:hypothetical protein
MRSISAEVTETLAQDPAYRPTHPFHASDLQFLRSVRCPFAFSLHMR